MLPLEYFLFLQIILFLFITPGTPRIVIISYSMNYGIKSCVWTALGDVTANLVQGTLVIFVIGSFFLDNPSFLNTFKWIGILYLVYLAYDIYNSVPKNINSSAKNCAVAFLSSELITVFIFKFLAAVQSILPSCPPPIIPIVGFDI